MTRGNQRELARAKAAKKGDAAKKGAKSDDGLSMEQRKHRDAEIMRQKQASKQADKDDKAKGATGGK